TPSSASLSVAHVALAPEPSDPLAGMQVIHVWRDCVWAAKIHPLCKLVLLCIGRYMDAHGRNCSMSYAQIARDCNIDESTAKRVIRKFSYVGPHRVPPGAELIEGIGRQNPYHAMTPPSVVYGVRAAKLAARQKKVTVAIGTLGGLKEKGGNARKNAVP